MIDDLTPYQIQIYLERIQEYGEVGLKGIEIFQAGQLLEFINNEMDEIVRWINEMILSNPNYEYPPEFPEGKRAKYWAESRDFDNKRKIRNIIKKFLLNHPAQTVNADNTPGGTDTNKQESDQEQKTGIEQDHEPKLSVKQIALKHVFDGPKITKINAQKTAESYGYTSGMYLHKQYELHETPTKRTEHPGTPRKLTEKIKLFESVKSLLAEQSKNEIHDEIRALKNKQ